MKFMEVVFLCKYDRYHVGIPIQLKDCGHTSKLECFQGRLCDIYSF